ncbi:terminase large subunit [Pseudomonas phage MiCath]|uniref:Terminase large subunit n=1 Tax=Pseudomonas phage MiCath TaxID=3003729 RepID=A0AAE9VDU3_9CAUD|nr:terminase large subunit [Pseudomonas phage MiCath]WAX22355.1 terminase large subunit [Pseudomonas phage MiCath]
MSKLLLERQMARWYKLKDHPVQLALVQAVENGIRFPVVPAGRRSGKTERAKRFVARQAMWYPNEKYFLAAPTYNQAKKIWWDDMKALTLSCLHVKAPSESDLKIFMPNGTEIHIIGLDQPQRIEGINWTGGVIDEIADVKSEALEANIMPALNTVNPMRPYYRAWCWFIGVPDGLNHYYDMAQYAQTSGDPDYGYFHWTSEEILPPDVIASAKRTMSPKQYNQEYKASFETANGRIYEDYGRDNHTNATILPHEPLYWTHDQNFTPLSSAIVVIRNGCPHFLDEIVLESAVSRQSAVEFVEKFKHHKNKIVYLYGDPAGKAGEKHGHKSDYTEIEEVLRLHKWRVERRVLPAHPAIKDRQNSVRAMIKNAAGDVRLFVNPVTAKWCHKGLGTVQFKKGSSFQEDQSNQYQHITTAIGYFIDVHWPLGRSKMRNGSTVGVQH